MAFFRKTKKEDSSAPRPDKSAGESRSSVQDVGTEKKDPKKTTLFGLIPHITEKATFLGEKDAYVFKVEPAFNKIMVRQAVKKQYNVEPVKVSIINIPGKTVFIRRRRAQRPGYKKAIVYLKKGDKITTS